MKTAMLAALLVLGTVACSGTKDTDTSETGETEETGSTDCSALSQADCEASPSCRSIHGALASEVCADDYSNWGSLYGGCMSNDVGCGDAETCGVNPATGEDWIFSDTCLPDGWATCSVCS